MILVSHRGLFEGDHRHKASGFATEPVGGVVNVLRPALVDTGQDVWVSLQRNSHHREMSAPFVQSSTGRHVAVIVDRDIYDRYYQGYANSVLWRLFHTGFDRIWDADLDGSYYEAWQAYYRVNEMVANAISRIATPEETVLINDYQLMLVPFLLSRERSDLAGAYFHHIPFVYPDSFDVIPLQHAQTILASVATYPAGFQSDRWLKAFQASYEALVEPRRRPGGFVAPVHPDVEYLTANMAGAAVREARDELRRLVRGRLLIARVDRGDPMKNLVRGLAAVESMLASHPVWRERFVFVHHVVPSRQELPEYASYTSRFHNEVRVLNDRWRTETWEPVVVWTGNDRARALALMAEYDVLLVNPIREGMNLVAQEGPLCNEKNGVLVLSTQCGSYDLLKAAALGIEPLDIRDTANGILEGLSMESAERVHRQAILRAQVLATSSPWHSRVGSAARRTS